MPSPRCCDRSAASRRSHHQPPANSLAESLVAHNRAVSRASLARSPEAAAAATTESPDPGPPDGVHQAVRRRLCRPADGALWCGSAAGVLRRGPAAAGALRPVPLRALWCGSAAGVLWAAGALRPGPLWVLWRGSAAGIIQCGPATVGPLQPIRRRPAVGAASALDPLLLRGAFAAPAPTYRNPMYGAPSVCGSTGYWCGSSAGQQVFPAGHPA